MVFLRTILIVVNAFTWYLIAFELLISMLDIAGTTSFETLLIWAVHFIGVTCSALIGAILSHKLINRDDFLSLWMFLGVASSLTPIILEAHPVYLGIISFLWAVSFGLGMPSCMGYYADSTALENRGRLGGLIYFAISISLFLLGITLISFTSFVAQVAVLTIWRGVGLAAFIVFTPEKKGSDTRKSPSYNSIIHMKAVLLYLIPWTMFSLVNSITSPIFPASIVQMVTLITIVVAGLSTLVGGLLCDLIGRKPIVIVGFLLLGIGYAILGMFPHGVSYYLYAIVDGVAWGMFGVVFLMVLWGDLSESMLPEKFYAIGGLPYLLSIFLRIPIAPYIQELVPTTATFSFASFFLFLAIIPLMYAPETLPEKKIRERELRKYVDRAKKIKEKYS